MSDSTRDPARILLVDPEGEMAPRLRPVLLSELLDEPIIIDLPAGRTALELLRTSRFDVVIADLEALADVASHDEDRVARLARAGAGALTVILAAESSVSASISAMRAGAHDHACRTLPAGTLINRLAQLAGHHGKAGLWRRDAAMSPPANEGVLHAIPAMRDLVMPMWRQEQRIIEAAIQSFAGDIALAAAALELSPSTIYRKRQAWAEMGEKGAA